ncbi:hypothetical protein [Polaromonas sp. LjRoot131]|uniref:hypothetical protein n=1 Tax=Polaromonas sp. LjRoot131 TaxID=3342262 RepID=UPI003ECD0181
MKHRQAAFLGAAIVALAGLGLSPAHAVPADAPWTLFPPTEEAVVFRGRASMDMSAGRDNLTLYPGPNAGIFAAAIITHGLLADSQIDRAKQALQDKADMVLRPYRPMLNDYKHTELMQAALDKTPWGGSKALAGPAQARGTGWVVESLPVFSMTQDQRALVLDHLVSVYPPGETNKPLYQFTVRVVSQARMAPDMERYWKDNAGAALKAESASLLAHSLALALRETAQPAAGDAHAFRTVRYPEGEAEKMERAQVLSQACDRRVIRTLRGWLMSVPSPAVADPSAASCEPALPGWK